MAKKSLKCSKCSRSFSMPAHLARHLNTIHSVNAGRRTATTRTATASNAGRARGAKGATRKVAGRFGTSAQSGTVSRLVSEMQSYLGELSRQRAALDAEESAIAGALRAMGGAAAAASGAPKRGRPAGRGVRDGSLKSFIVRVLSQRTQPISPRDIALAVTKQGYKSQAKDLTKAVSNSLPELKKVKKVGFGLYKLY